jgi:hypothetical protein
VLWIAFCVMFPVISIFILHVIKKNAGKIIYNYTYSLLILCTEFHVMCRHSFAEVARTTRKVEQASPMVSVSCYPSSIFNVISVNKWLLTDTACGECLLTAAHWHARAIPYRQIPYTGTKTKVLLIKFAELPLVRPSKTCFCSLCSFKSCLYKLHKRVTVSCIWFYADKNKTSTNPGIGIIWISLK